MKKIAISILFLIFCGCDQDVRIEPDYSKFGSPTTWVYYVEKRISEQLAERGFVEVYYKEPYDLVAHGIRGTWTNDEDFWSTENIYLKIIDPEKAAPSLAGDEIHGKFEFKSPFRRALWWYNWSIDEELSKKIHDYALKLYLEKHNKN